MTETTTDKTKRRNWTMTKLGKPTLGQARDAVDLGHDHVCRVVPVGQVGDDVAEQVAADVVVSLPGVGVDLGATLNALEHEVGERLGAGVGDAAHPYPPW